MISYLIIILTLILLPLPFLITTLTLILLTGLPGSYTGPSLTSRPRYTEELLASVGCTEGTG